MQVVYPQLDCKLLEGSYHFTHSSPSPTRGAGFLKTPGEEKSGLRNLGPYWGKNRVRGMKSRVNLGNHYINNQENFSELKDMNSKIESVYQVPVE